MECHSGHVRLMWILKQELPQTTFAVRQGRLHKLPQILSATCANDFHCHLKRNTQNGWSARCKQATSVQVVSLIWLVTATGHPVMRLTTRHHAACLKIKLPLPQIVERQSLWFWPLQGAPRLPRCGVRSCQCSQGQSNPNHCQLGKHFQTRFVQGRTTKSLISLRSKYEMFEQGVLMLRGVDRLCCRLRRHPSHLK